MEAACNSLVSDGLRESWVVVFEDWSFGDVKGRDGDGGDGGLPFDKDTAGITLL